MVARRESTAGKTAADSGDFVRLWDPSAGTEKETNAMGVGIKGAVESFTDADATPSVATGQVAYQTANTGATTITDFDDGYEGQTILVVLDANTTVDMSANSNIRGNTGSDFAAAANDAIRCTLVGTTWYCTVINAAA